MLDLYNFLGGAIAGIVIGFLFGIIVVVQWLDSRHIKLFRNNKGMVEIIDMRKGMEK